MPTDVKKQIAETFEKHAMRTGIDKVTVNAVVSECGISRQAFYYYFQDIVDVARYLIREKLSLTLDTGGEAEEPKQAVMIFARELVSQFPVISIAMNSKLRAEMEALLVKELKDFFCTIFVRTDLGRGLSRSQIDFRSEIMACGIFGYAIEHCHERDFDAELLGEQLWDLMKHAYAA